MLFLFFTFFFQIFFGIEIMFLKILCLQAVKIFILPLQKFWQNWCSRKSKKRVNGLPLKKNNDFIEGT